MVNPDLEGMAGHPALCQELVVGHEQQRGVELEPALDALESFEIGLEKAALQVASITLEGAQTGGWRQNAQWAALYLGK